MTAAAARTLVVDDESVVRLLVRRILEPEVCAVIEAEDGESALRLIERGEQPIDVVLTDLVMPGIDGFDIVEVLARHRPDIAVVCMSGFASAAHERLNVPFVPKPFSLETLQAALQPVIARARMLRRDADGGQLRATASMAQAQSLRRFSGANLSHALDLVAAARELRAKREPPPSHPQ